MNEPAMREKQLNIRLSPEEAERMEWVSNHYGLNGAQLFRMLLKREETALRGGGAATPAPPSATTTKRPKKR